MTLEGKHSSCPPTIFHDGIYFLFEIISQQKINGLLFVCTPIRSIIAIAANFTNQVVSTIACAQLIRPILTCISIVSVDFYFSFKACGACNDSAGITSCSRLVSYDFSRTTIIYRYRISTCYQINGCCGITTAAALAFMVFVLLYFPCIATFVATKNETGRWRWAILLALYTILVAWLCAFAAYRIGLLCGL